MLVDLL